MADKLRAESVCKIVVNQSCSLRCKDEASVSRKLTLKGIAQHWERVISEARDALMFNLSIDISHALGIVKREWVTIDHVRSGSLIVDFSYLVYATTNQSTNSEQALHNNGTFANVSKGFTAITGSPADVSIFLSIGEPDPPVPTTGSPETPSPPSPSSSIDDDDEALFSPTTIIATIGGVGGAVIFAICTILLLKLRRRKMKSIAEERTAETAAASDYFSPLNEDQSACDVRLSDELQNLRKCIETGAPELQVLGSARKISLLLTSYRPSRPESAFITVLNVLASAQASTLRARTKREIALATAMCSVHASQKCIRHNMTFSIETISAWEGRLSELQKSSTPSVRSSSKSSSGGCHSNCVDFALDVIKECISSIDAHLATSAAEEFSRGISAAAAACVGDLVPLMELARETARLYSQGRVPKDTHWISVVATNLVLRPDLAAADQVASAQNNSVMIIDGGGGGGGGGVSAESSGDTRTTTQNDVLAYVMIPPPATKSNWHIIYQWLVTMEHTAAEPTVSTTVRADACRAISSAGLSEHKHWRVREKLAETVHIVSVAEDLPRESRELMLHLLTELQLCERDSRVLHSMAHFENETSLLRLLRENKDALRAHTDSIVQKKQCQAEKRVAELAQSEKEPQVLDSDWQGMLFAAEDAAEQLTTIQRRADAFISHLVDSKIDSLDHDFSNLQESLQHSLDSIVVNVNSEFNNLKQTVDSLMRQVETQRTTMHFTPVIQNSECTDNTLMCEINLRYEELHSRATTANDEHPHRERMRRLSSRLEGPVARLVTMFSKQQQHEEGPASSSSSLHTTTAAAQPLKYFMILSDILSTLSASLELFHSSIRQEQIRNVNPYFHDVNHRLHIAFEKLQISFDIDDGEDILDALADGIANRRVVALRNRGASAEQQGQRQQDQHARGIALDANELCIVANDDIEFATGPASVLGSGSFGIVLRAKLSGNDVAVKVFTLTNAIVVDSALSEAKLQARLFHPNIVTLFGVIADPQKVSLVMELCSGGTLADLIFDSSNTLPISEKIRLSCELAEAMQYLHTTTTHPVTQQPTKVIHGDLKPGNILLDEQHHVKLTDFGHATMRSSSLSAGMSLNPGHRGTIGYQSPEARQNKPLTTRSDVFSFGIVLYEIWARKKAFTDDAEVAEALEQHAMPSLRSSRLAPVAQIIAHCWCVEPHDRSNFCEIVTVLRELANQ